ncbi:hypothetical protein J7E16_07485 [Carnobacterium sp. ISL-102]|nr:hypothetical protein [Carnobacterium sp. ISL-102]
MRFYVGPILKFIITGGWWNQSLIMERRQFGLIPETDEFFLLVELLFSSLEDEICYFLDYPSELTG